MKNIRFFFIGKLSVCGFNIRRRVFVMKITGKLGVIIHLIRVHFKERSAEDVMRGVFNDAYALLLSDFMYKNIYCGYSFRVPTTYVFIKECI